MSKKIIKNFKNIKILLNFLTISTSKEPHLSDSGIIDKGLKSRSDLLHSNLTRIPKKRTKPLDHPFKSMEFFIKYLNEKKPKINSENDLTIQDVTYNNFDEISEGCSEENTQNINGPENSREKSLISQKESGSFIKREIMKIVELKHNEPHRDQIELKNFNEGIKANFVSKLKELKNKKGWRAVKKWFYTHNNINIYNLYGYLLKPGVYNMCNLSLLQILISEIEYNNKVMIYCFLASRTYKLLCFIFEGADKLRITPIFFYRVGCFMKKYCSFDTSKDIDRKFAYPWKKGRYSKNDSLSGFKNIYMTLKTHSGIKMPELSVEIDYETYKKEGLVISALYNKVKSQY